MKKNFNLKIICFFKHTNNSISKIEWRPKYEIQKGWLRSSLKKDVIFNSIASKIIWRLVPAVCTPVVNDLKSFIQYQSVCVNNQMLHKAVSGSQNHTCRLNVCRLIACKGSRHTQSRNLSRQPIANLNWRNNS